MNFSVGRRGASRAPGTGGGTASTARASVNSLTWANAASTRHVDGLDEGAVGQAQAELDASVGRLVAAHDLRQADRAAPGAGAPAALPAAPSSRRSRGARAGGRRRRAGGRGTRGSSRPRPARPIGAASARAGSSAAHRRTSLCGWSAGRGASDGLAGRLRAGALRRADLAGGVDAERLQEAQVLQVDAERRALAHACGRLPARPAAIRAARARGPPRACSRPPSRRGPCTGCSPRHGSSGWIRARAPSPRSTR